MCRFSKIKRRVIYAKQTIPETRKVYVSIFIIPLVSHNVKKLLQKYEKMRKKRTNTPLLDVSALGKVMKN